LKFTIITFTSILFSFFIQFPQPLIADGQKLYKTHCGNCHGQNGEGGTAYALNKEGLLITADLNYFKNSIIFGRPLSGCPPQEDSLNEEEIHDISSFIKSWQKGKLIDTPAHKVLAEDNAKGKELFPICGACHGLKTEGAMGPPLFDPGFLKSASDQVIRRTIMYGRPGTPMKGFIQGQGYLPLSLSDIDSIISYMRYRQTLEIDK